MAWSFGGHMQRRAFITLLGGSAIGWPLALHAQAAKPIIGFFNGQTATNFQYLVAAFLRGLKEKGFVEGQNVTIEYVWANGRFDLLPELAGDLVSHRPTVIVAAGGAHVAAIGATKTIPIVAIGVLMSANPVHVSLLKQVQAAARTLGVTIFPVTARLPTDLDAAFSTLSKERYDGLIVLADTRIVQTIPTLALQAQLPAIYQFADFAKLGGLLGYGPNLAGLFRRAAVFVDKIFKGANPADLPVEQPTKFDLFVNLRAAKALNLTVPPTLLALADEVIE